MERGSIYFINQNHNTGSEQKNLRPVIIVSNNVGNFHAPIVTVCSITSREKKPMPTHVELQPMDGGLYMKSTILCEQIQTIDKRFLGKYIGAITNPDTLKRLDNALKISLSLQEE